MAESRGSKVAKTVLPSRLAHPRCHYCDQTSGRTARANPIRWLKLSLEKLYRFVLLVLLPPPPLIVVRVEKTFMSRQSIGSSSAYSPAGIFREHFSAEDRIQKIFS